MEAFARLVLGGKHNNCRGPRTEPWGTSFQNVTEMQSLHCIFKCQSNIGAIDYQIM